MISISNDFCHKIKMYNCDPYNVSLFIATNTHQNNGVTSQVEELRRDLRIKSQELEVKNAAANDKLKKMVKDQQEAEKKKARVPVQRVLQCSCAAALTGVVWFHRSWVRTYRKRFTSSRKWLKTSSWVWRRIWTRWSRPSSRLRTVRL